ncbi:amino acid transporter, putative [Plasmodium malariae]|uniref:Amino acid transporter, putative n=1 Tax=Plasmodium malariae TaxID=5858 RepID=A0A1A8WG73_PLAMA|nr:amino acid transporter, putative [Plasmodium malariae]
MNLKWLHNISLFNDNKLNSKKKFVRSRKRFRTITWKYTKTIGPLASFIYLFNQIIGSGLFDIPSLIDEVGWIPVIFGNTFVCSVAVFCSLMILRAMTMIPKNKNFEQRIEYSAVIKYFMSNEKYKFVSFLYHLGNICNNICGILVISKIIDIFIIKLFGFTILFQVYPQLKITKCSLSLLDAMFNGFYYTSTGHYETIIIGGFTIGYIINAIICIHLSSKGLEETINYQYVVFMIFMSSFLYLSISSTIYLLSENYIDNAAPDNNVDINNNLILNRAYFEKDLIKNYYRYNEVNNFKEEIKPCKDTFFPECSISMSPIYEKIPFSKHCTKNKHIIKNNNVLNKYIKRRERNNLLYYKKGIFCCSLFSLNPLYQKKVYVFRNSIFYITFSSCSKDLKIKNTNSNQYFYSIYKIYHERNSRNNNIENFKTMTQLHKKKEDNFKKQRTKKKSSPFFKNSLDDNVDDDDGGGVDSHNDREHDDKQHQREQKFARIEKKDEKDSKRNDTNNNRKNGKQNKMFFKNLYYMISKIEGIKSYCMGKTFANFIDSYGFVGNIPSWGNEITDDVNVSKAIWFAVIFSSIFYFIFGLIFCLNNSFQNINTSILHIFNLVAVAPKVITGSISMRYDLMNLDICSDNAAFFFGCVAPFLFAWIFSNGILFSNVFNYISLICGLFCNFLSPAFAYISACESNESFYKNPLRKYTIVNRKKTVFSSSSDIRRALGNIIDNFDDNDEYYQEEDVHSEKKEDVVEEDNQADEIKGSIEYNKPLSLNESLNSASNRSRCVNFIDGEHSPKSYPKEVNEFDNLSNKISQNLKSLNLEDTFSPSKKRDINVNDENIRGTDIANTCHEKKGKKKKGVMFANEVNEYYEQTNIEMKNVLSSYDTTQNVTDTNDAHKYYIDTKDTHTNDAHTNANVSNNKDKCKGKKKVAFSKESHTTNDDDNNLTSEIYSSEFLKYKRNSRNIKERKNTKKKLMFVDEVEMYGDEDTDKEYKKKNQKKGVTFFYDLKNDNDYYNDLQKKENVKSKEVMFKAEVKNQIVENAKNKRNGGKKVKFSNESPNSNEENDVRENRESNITENYEKCYYLNEEQKGNSHFTNGTAKCTESATEKCYIKKDNRHHLLAENKKNIESIALDNEKFVLQYSNKNDINVMKYKALTENEKIRSENICTNSCYDMSIVHGQPNDDQNCVHETFTNYKIKIISNNSCMKAYYRKNAENDEHCKHFENGTAEANSESKNNINEYNINLKEKEDRNNSNLVHVHFEQDKQKESSFLGNNMDNPKNVLSMNKAFDNFALFERNYSDSDMYNNNVQNEIKNLEHIENDIITENRNFDQNEKVFKRQREKLKHRYRCNMTNVQENLYNLDNLVQHIESLNLKDKNTSIPFDNITLKKDDINDEINLHKCNTLNEASSSVSDESKPSGKTLTEETLTNYGNVSINKKVYFYSQKNTEANITEFDTSVYASANIIAHDTPPVHRSANTTENNTSAYDFPLRKLYSKNDQIINSSTEKDSLEHVMMEENFISNNLNEENLKNYNTSMNMKELNDEKVLKKRSPQIGMQTYQRGEYNIITKSEEQIGFNKIQSECYNDTDVKTQNYTKDTFINNSTNKTEFNVLFNKSEMGNEKEKRGNINILSASEQNSSNGFKKSEKNTLCYSSENLVGKNDSNQEDILYPRNYNEQKGLSVDITLLPQDNSIIKMNMKSSSLNDSIRDNNNNGKNNNNIDDSKRKTLFVRQRKKLKSSFHANGGMIIGDHKEAIHKEQINELRKQISKESNIFDYYNNEKCTGIVKQEECQQNSGENIDQNKTNKENTNVQDNAKQEMPIVNIMKSYKMSSITPNLNVPLDNNGGRSKSKGRVGETRHKTQYVFRDISKLLSDIDEHKLEPIENENIDNNVTNENKENYIVKQNNNTNYDSNKIVNLNEEGNENKEKFPSEDIEKSDIIKTIEKIYTELANKMHSENSEISTYDDNDDTDYVDIRYFKIIDNNNPVKHYYNTFHRSKILERKKYDHIYSNNIMIDNKTNMDHLCSIFLFGNPLERNEEYENKKKINTHDEAQPASNDFQNAATGRQDSYDATTTFSTTINCENTRNTSNSGVCEHKEYAKSFPSGILQNDSEILKKNIIENKNCLNSTKSILSLRKRNVNFSIHNEDMNSQELNDILQSNAVGDLKKNSSDKIEVMKIRIYVYPSFLQKYHVETTYVLLGCLTAFSFLGMITDLLFG